MRGHGDWKRMPLTSACTTMPSGVVGFVASDMFSPGGVHRVLALPPLWLPVLLSEERRGRRGCSPLSLQGQPPEDGFHSLLRPRPPSHPHYWVEVKAHHGTQRPEELQHTGEGRPHLLHRRHIFDGCGGLEEELQGVLTPWFPGDQ